MPALLTAAPKYRPDRQRDHHNPDDREQRTRREAGVQSHRDVEGYVRSAGVPPAVIGRPARSLIRRRPGRPPTAGKDARAPYRSAKIIVRIDNAITTIPTIASSGRGEMRFVDRDSSGEMLVFNRTATLKDTFGARASRPQ